MTLKGQTKCKPLLFPALLTAVFMSRPTTEYTMMEQGGSVQPRGSATLTLKDFLTFRTETNTGRNLDYEESKETRCKSPKLRDNLHLSFADSGSNGMVARECRQR